MSELPFEPVDPREGRPLVSPVLIVDDEQVIRDLLARILARETDLLLAYAESAEDALERVRAQRFQLLVADKNLPGLDGVQLIAQARALQPELEAIMITGYPSAESLIGALAAGASDYLLKPFAVNVVRAKIRAALERKAERQKLQLEGRQLAQRASELLEGGRRPPESVWLALQDALRDYERAVRDGADPGRICVVGNREAAITLAAAGFRAEEAAPEASVLLGAEVVVIDTGLSSWHALAERLISSGADVVALARPEAGLTELLESMSLHLDLVGFGGTWSASLPDRIRAHLMKRTVDRAQERLMAAVAEFRNAVGAAAASVK